MGCDISGEQLWSWIDRDAPELDDHLAICPTCRARATKIRNEIGLLAVDEAFEIPVPDKIGPYVIKRVVGEGGQALVYEAEQPSPRRSVALKVLKGGHLIDKNHLRKFRRESHALGRLNHRSIATIYEAGRTQDGLHYFAMELVDGQPLHTFVKEKKPTRKEVLVFFRKLCDAIQYAHDNGVIHRDLKPSNIMVDSNGEPRILDFGLARLTQGELGTMMTATRDGRVEGTPRYMSPEQALGQVKRIDARTDVYALGVILYELLTGQPPNKVTTISPQTILTICEEMPRKPSDIAPDLGDELDAILLKALEKEPERRYQTVAALGEDLGRHLDGKPIAAKSPSQLYALRKSLARKKSWIAVGVTAAVVISAIIIWFPGPEPYNIAAARRSTLLIKCELFRGGSADLTYYQARQAPSRFPGLPEAILVAAQACYLNREQNVALTLLASGLESNPDSWPYQALINEIRARQYHDGTGTVDTLYWTDELAATADAWYLRSFTALDAATALIRAKEALRREPKHELSLSEVALLLEINGDLDGALTASQALIDANYLISKWAPFRATLLMKMGRYEEALDQCREWIDDNPLNYHANFLLGKVQRRMKRYEDAERSFTLAIGGHEDTDLTAAWLYFHRGAMRWLIDEKEGAISDYREAYASLAYQTYGNARLYILLHEVGRPGEAEASLSESRNSDVVDPWLREIFDCLAGVIAPDELAAIAQESKNPIQVCEGYYYAGEAALLRGSIDEAAMWFEKSLDTGVAIDPRDATESISEYELAGWRLNELKEEAGVLQTRSP